MRNLDCNVLQGLDAEDINGITIDANQIVSASFHAYFGDAVSGTFKLQASNDIPPSGYTAGMQNFTPTNWVDIPTKTAAISAGTPALLTIPQSAYRWLRASWTNTDTGSQSITTVGAGYGVAQAVTAICVPDVAGSLNNTYWIVYAAPDDDGYYVWYNVNGGGTDPAPVGLIGIEVAIAENDSDIDIAIASGTAIDAVGSGSVFNAFGSEGTIIVFNIVEGPATAPSDGPGGNATGFTIDLALPGVNPGAIQLGNRYFFINEAEADGGVEYYFWFNVDGGGVDPGPFPGKTGVALDLFESDTANGVAQTIVTALLAIPAFTNIDLPFDTNTLTFDNVSAGSFIPASDFNTTFTFEVTSGGSSTATVNMDALSS